MLSIAEGGRLNDTLFLSRIFLIFFSLYYPTYIIMNREYTILILRCSFI